MSDKYIYFGKVQDGKLVIERQTFQRDLKAFEGKQIELSICRLSKKRTSQQNRFMWGFLIQPITYRLQELGWDINGKIISRQDVHDMLCLKFLKESIVNHDSGEILETIRGTSGLTTTEMNSFWAQVQQWAAENIDLVLADPVILEETI